MNTAYKINRREDFVTLMIFLRKILCENCIFYREDFVQP